MSKSSLTSSTVDHCERLVCLLPSNTFLPIYPLPHTHTCLFWLTGGGFFFFSFT